MFVCQKGALQPRDRGSREGAAPPVVRTPAWARLPETPLLGVLAVGRQVRETKGLNGLRADVDVQLVDTVDHHLLGS